MNRLDTNAQVLTGRISRVAGPTVEACGLRGVRMYDRVIIGEMGLQGEVIRLDGDVATCQVYEDTTGLSLDEPVISTGEPLLVELGPGLLGSVFDGVQRPLGAVAAVSGDFISRGIAVPALARDRRFLFSPLRKTGETAWPGDVLGEVPEVPGLAHRILAPPGVSGKIEWIGEGGFSLTEPVVRLEDGRTMTMVQRWPVRVPRPAARRLPPGVPFLTGQRVFDVLFPVAAGGTAVVPGGFGTGKTVVEQTLAKYAAADVIVYVGCGERGNEMTEVLEEFPRLVDPRTGGPLMDRTVLVVNTSNMPVAAREASIYTGITIAEYYRDMGYSVAMMADSTSRWAEALREISSRLEEMPGEEGYPTTLGTRLAQFYERAGRVTCLGGGNRTGALTLISAISPAGGDFSEPVTQASLRVAGALWGLDLALAHRRHYPAVDWKVSFSQYTTSLDPWFRENAAPDWPETRARLMRTLEREAEVQEIVQLVGIDAIPEEERILLDAAEILRESYLRQNAFSPVDGTCPPAKQSMMLKVIFAYFDHLKAALAGGAVLEDLLVHPLRREVLSAPERPVDGFEEWAGEITRRLSSSGPGEGS